MGPLLEILKPRRKTPRPWILVALLAGLAGLLLPGSVPPGDQIGSAPPSRTSPLDEVDPASRSTAQATAQEPETTPEGNAVLPPSDIDAADRAIATPIRSPSPLQGSAPAEELSWISLDQPELRIGRPTSMAAMILRRNSGPERRARIVWNTLPGTALPGVDYVPVTEGVVDFADNQNVSSLYVTLLNKQGTTGERTFFIEISSATNEVNAGPVTRVAVTIGD